MSSYMDLSLSPEVARAVYKVLPEFTEEDPEQLVAAVVLMDQQAGKDRDDNIIAVHPELLLYLMLTVTIVDGSLPDKETFLAMSEEEILAIFDENLAKGMKVEFKPRQNTDGYEFPEVIRGQTRILRTMTDEEIDRDMLAFTTTANGEPIRL